MNYQTVLYRSIATIALCLTAHLSAFAAETETAINRTHVGEFQQHAVWIPVHDAGKRAPCIIADGIVQFVGCRHQFLCAWHELSRDWVDRVERINQLCHGGCNGDSIALGNRVYVVAEFRRLQAGSDKVISSAKCGPRFGHWQNIKTGIGFFRTLGNLKKQTRVSSRST